MSGRASLGFADALDGFDPAEWSPAEPPPRPPEAATALAARAAGFRSREPKETPLPAEPVVQRRRRTGRSTQLNLKVRPETVTAYCTLADRMGWGLGETLERAVELLEREYGLGTKNR